MDERLSVPVQRRREGKPSRSVGAMGAGGWKSSRWRGQPTFFLTSKGFRTVSGYDQARERGQGRQNLQNISGSADAVDKARHTYYVDGRDPIRNLSSPPRPSVGVDKIRAAHHDRVSSVAIL